jgi:hypothetical protein
MRGVVAGPGLAPLVYGSVIFDFGDSARAATPQLRGALWRRRFLLHDWRAAELVPYAQPPGRCRLLFRRLAAAGLNTLLVLLNPAEGRRRGKVGVAAEADARLAAVRPRRAEAA